MITTDMLIELVKEQKEFLKLPKKRIGRELFTRINTKTNHAVIVSGIRRCGKSTLLTQLMQDYKNYNYFNFEDPRLESFLPHDFEKLSSAFETVNGVCNVYFFDEIQNLNNWEKYVRYLLDRKAKVFITGSNAALLSREFGTKLTGRNLRYELFPFSFLEYCKFCSLQVSYKSFQKYFEDGGFPEFLKFKEPKVLQDVYFDILYRDVMVRHNIRDEKSLKLVTNYLISNIGKEFSYNQLRQTFSLGTANTTINYVSYLEDSYVLFVVPMFSYSLKKQAVNNKKVYVIDNKFGKEVSNKFTKDFGRMLENMVFLHLKKQYSSIYYYKNEGECDFLVEDGGKILAAYQVCLNLTEDNLERELNGLISAVKETKVKIYCLLTMNQEEVFHKDGFEIKAIPFWKWCQKNK